MATINIDFPTFHSPKKCRNVIRWNILRLFFVRTGLILVAVSMCYRAIAQWKTNGDGHCAMCVENECEETFARRSAKEHSMSLQWIVKTAVFTLNKLLLL